MTIVMLIGTGTGVFGRTRGLNLGGTSWTSKTCQLQLYTISKSLISGRYSSSNKLCREVMVHCLSSNYNLLPLLMAYVVFVLVETSIFESFLWYSSAANNFFLQLIVTLLNADLQNTKD